MDNTLLPCRKNTDKIILHLCAGKHGSDSKRYADAGYDVRLIGIEKDVRKQCPQSVYGIIANPPCTHLSGSGARWWEQKGESALFEALAIADACCRMVLLCKPTFWVLENPVGRLTRYYGKPTMTYQPYEYGDPWTKRTCLWGNFNIPIKTPVIPTMGSIMHKMAPSEDRSEKRSICSPGFAKAFFDVNQ